MWIRFKMSSMLCSFHFAESLPKIISLDRQLLAPAGVAQWLTSFALVPKKGVVDPNRGYSFTDEGEKQNARVSRFGSMLAC